MGRRPEHRHRADILITVELGGEDDATVEDRLIDVIALLEYRVGRSTFARLPGRPEFLYVGQFGDTTAV